MKVTSTKNNNNLLHSSISQTVFEPLNSVVSGRSHFTQATSFFHFKLLYTEASLATGGFCCKSCIPAAWCLHLREGRPRGPEEADEEDLRSSLRQQHLREFKKIGEDGETPAWAPAECPGHNWRHVRHTSGVKASIGQGNYWGKRCNPLKFFQEIWLKTKFHVGCKEQNFSRSADITLACNFLQTLFSQMVSCLKRLAVKVLCVAHISSRMKL